MAGLPDHEREAEEVRKRIYRSMTFAQKWRECQKLYSLAWQMRRAGLAARYPTLPAAELDRKVREEFLFA